jgi:hypothetical protein
MADITQFPGAVRFKSTVTHQNASGAYVNGKNTVVKRVAFTAASANIDSGAIHIPANSAISSIEVIVTSATTQANGTLGVQAGTQAGGEQLIAAAADALAGTSTTVAAGKGTSTEGTGRRTALGGNGNLTMVADSPYYAAAGEAHVRCVSSGGAFSAGEIAFIVVFDYLGGN